MKRLKATGNLALSRESLRSLSAEALDQMNGGVFALQCASYECMGNGGVRSGSPYCTGTHNCPVGYTIQ